GRGRLPELFASHRWVGDAPLSCLDSTREAPGHIFCTNGEIVPALASGNIELHDRILPRRQLDMSDRRSIRLVAYQHLARYRVTVLQLNPELSGRCFPTAWSYRDRDAWHARLQTAEITHEPVRPIDAHAIRAGDREAVADGIACPNRVRATG